MSDHDAGGGYSRRTVWANAVVALAVTALVIWAANGFGVGTESLSRVSPTLAGGGVGADWVEGNQVGWLNLLVAFVHLVDVVMGLFILAMVFVHWGAFRRLAARMRRPDAGEAATDGGEVTAGGGETTADAAEGGEAG